MSTLDWIFCAFFAFSVLHGLWRGLIKEVLDLAAWAIGFVAAQTFATELGGAFAGDGREPGTQVFDGLCGGVDDLPGGDLHAVKATQHVHQLHWAWFFEQLDGCCFCIDKSVCALFVFGHHCEVNSFARV